jgi:enterochelin esterase-like enzyme
MPRTRPLPPVGALGYEVLPGRDLRLDLLRGAAVVAMVVDHLAGSSPLYVLTGGNRFYTSAAEGFVFLSGLLVGLTYRRIAERDGLSAGLWRLLERAWTLYLLAVGLTLVVLPVSELLGLPWATGVDMSNPPALVWSILTLHQTYYLVDVPLLYALLLVVAPLAFILLWTGRTATLLALSWLVWAGYQVLPGGTELPWPIQDNNLFQLPAWQVLFFTAMALGFHKERVRAAIPARRDRWLLALSGLSVVGLISLAAITTPLLDAIQTGGGGATQGNLQWLLDLQGNLFAKADVRPGRIVASACVFTLCYLATSHFWVPIRRVVGWFLLPLGQHALYAYSVHIVLAVVLAAASLTLHLNATGSPESNTVIQVVSLGVIWLAIRARVLYPNEHTRRRWMAAVAPLAAGLLVVLEFTPAAELARAAPAPEAVPQTQADRVAQAFGTPLPRTSSPFGLTANTAPLPTPAPAARPTVLTTGTPSRTIPYVGALQGTIRERHFYSQALDRDMSYYVYVPPGYGTDGRRYPVLYMLHGGGGSKDEWLAYGIVDALDRMIVAQSVQPIILILPQGDTGYWVNQPDGPRWGDYVASDLVRQVDATFRTVPSGMERAIGGLSMGGAGALQLAFNHPDVFGIVGAHSPALHLDDGTFSLYGTGNDFAHREPLNLAANAPGIQRVRIWIDAGEQDPWLDRDTALDTTLTSRGIAHDWHILPGGHEGLYWKLNVPTYLRFCDTAFGAPVAK